MVTCTASLGHPSHVVASQRPMAALPRPQPSHCGLKVRDWQAIPPVHWHSPRTHYAIADCRLPGATRQPSYRHAAPPPPLASSGPQPQQASWLHICREVGHQGFPALRLTSNGPKQHPCMWWVLATAGPRAAAAVKLAPARLAAPPAPPPPPPAAADTAVGAGAFEELCAGTERKYIMVSGKGGVGKTSLGCQPGGAVCPGGPHHAGRLHRPGTLPGGLAGTGGSLQGGRGSSGSSRRRLSRRARRLLMCCQRPGAGFPALPIPSSAHRPAERLTPHAALPVPATTTACRTSPAACRCWWRARRCRCGAWRLTPSGRRRSSRRGRQVGWDGTWCGTAGQRYMGRGIWAQGRCK